MPEVIRTEHPYRGRIVQVRVDEVRREDGHPMRLEVVEHSPSVGIVPLREDGRVVLIRQYRHATGEDLLEIPAGSVDPGESGEECAQRELAEEIGFRARRIARLGGFYLCPGYLTEFMEIYLAQGLQPATATPDEDEQIDLAEMSLEEALRLSARGELRDGKTIAALAMAAAYLGVTGRRGDGATERG
jgi:ADP-ribose pyrophosphatase